MKTIASHAAIGLVLLTVSACGASDEEICDQAQQILTSEQSGTPELVDRLSSDEGVQETCPQTVDEWFGGSGDSPDDVPSPESTEPDGGTGTGADEEPTLLEKQCYAASEIARVGNGPGSPYSDYTDEDIAEAEAFVAANC